MLVKDGISSLNFWGTSIVGEGPPPPLFTFFPSRISVHMDLLPC